MQEVHDQAPVGHFTLGWLMGSLHERSFDLIMLLLGIVAAAPGISFVAGLLLMIPACQMIAGRRAPAFPRRIAARPLPTRHLAALVQRAVPVLRYLEKLIHPRWHTPRDVTKRVVGFVVMMLSATLILVPIPLSNVVPALVIALIALAHLEADGLLLSIALLAGCVVLALEAGAIWQTIIGAEWVSHVL
ncbi:MAG TPA: exopolysaccharide biosynthesis protein [Acidisphaera sp.]|nr:exopolysaccharide biosynthesis protein [Acidisphaera sp.]